MEIKTLRALQPLAERPVVQRPVRDPDARGGHRAGQAPGEEVGRTRRRLSRRRSTRPTTLTWGPRRAPARQGAEDAGWNHAGTPVIIQSFEQANLKLLNSLTPQTARPARRRQTTSTPMASPRAALFDRPYDWTASGKKSAPAARSTTSRPTRGSRRSATTPTGSGPEGLHRQFTSHPLTPTGRRRRRERRRCHERGRPEGAPADDVVERAHDHGLRVHT